MLSLTRPRVTPKTLLTRLLEEVETYSGSTEDVIEHSTNAKELMAYSKPLMFKAIVDAIENLPPEPSNEKTQRRFKALTGLILHASRLPREITKREYETTVKAWVNLCQVLARL